MGSKRNARGRARIRAKRSGIATGDCVKACTERRKGAACASCLAPCPIDRSNVVVNGEKLIQFASCSNPTIFPFPFCNVIDVVLCRCCLDFWKVILLPNSVERRAKEQSAANRKLDAGLNKYRYKQEKKCAEIFCMIRKELGVSSGG